MRHTPTSRELIDTFVDVLAERLKVKPAAEPSALDSFIAEQCANVPGESVKFADFSERFWGWLEARGFDVQAWGKMVIINHLPSRYAYGVGNSNIRYVGNLKWVEDCRPRLVAVDGRLKQVGSP